MNVSKSSLIALGLTLACFAMSSCAKVRSSTSPATKTSSVQEGGGLPLAKVSSTTIQGSWATAACTQDKKTGANYTQTILIQNDAVTTDTITYDDVNCTVPLAEEERISSFTLVTSDITQMSEKLVSTRFRALDAVIARLYNQSKFCGLSNWVANTYETILATDIANCANVDATPGFHAVLYGAKELYLDDCADSVATSGTPTPTPTLAPTPTPAPTVDDSSCTTVRYIRMSN